jgi:hypothetical protein
LCNWIAAAIGCGGGGGGGLQHRQLRDGCWFGVEGTETRQPLHRLPHDARVPHFSIANDVENALGIYRRCQNKKKCKLVHNGTNGRAEKKEKKERQRWSKFVFKKIQHTIEWTHGGLEQMVG